LRPYEFSRVFQALVSTKVKVFEKLCFLSPTATNIIARRESPGQIVIEFLSLKATNNLRQSLFVTFSDGLFSQRHPAILAGL